MAELREHGIVSKTRTLKSGKTVGGIAFTRVASLPVSATSNRISVEPVSVSRDSGILVQRQIPLSRT
jgi:hypothetical protein